MLTTIKHQVSRERRMTFPNLLLAVWVLVMVSIPIVRWTLGDGAKLPLISAGVALQATAVLAILWQAWGWRRTMVTAAAILVLTLLVEMAGSLTGIPFGHYSYTDVLQPQLGGVPWLIPLAWLMMLPPAWATAAGGDRRQAAMTDPRRWWPSLRFAILSALALTAWDLMLDPQMVSWNLWQWDEPGGYFGIPWQNFGGWFGTALVLTLLLRPRRLPRRPLLVIYTITWFLEVVGLALFWGMPGPALVGGLAMLAFVIRGWRSLGGQPASRRAVF